MAEKIVETVTVEREVTGPVLDLVLFVKYLRQMGRVGPIPEDAVLIQEARNYWDREHGED